MHNIPQLRMNLELVTGRALEPTVYFLSLADEFWISYTPSLYATGVKISTGQRMRWLDGIADSTHRPLGTFREVWRAAAHGAAKRCAH